jgi:hypothetical protein
MPDKLYWNTVTPLLRTVLDQLMVNLLFASFRLVGGTSLSLQLGHRISVDIDLFTDAPYGSIDFDAINDYLKDFWDLHELLDQYSVQQMIDLHSERYPYTHDEIVIRSNLALFTNADDDFDPDCLRGKFWEIIKLDMIEAIGKYS